MMSEFDPPRCWVRSGPCRLDRGHDGPHDWQTAANPADSAEALLPVSIVKRWLEEWQPHSPVPVAMLPAGYRSSCTDVEPCEVHAAFQASAPSPAAESPAGSREGLSHQELIDSGLHECASDCQSREDL